MEHYPLSAEEKILMKSRIAAWLLPENISWAKGKTREEIFAKFGNELKAIAYINVGYLPYLGGEMSDNRVYSGMGYFIDHVVNSHPEVSIEEYGKIQDILNNPNEVKLDNRKENNSLIFIKKYNVYFAEVVNVDKSASGKIIFHKTLYYKEKVPQKGLPNVELILSLVDGLPTISPAK